MTGIQQDIFGNLVMFCGLLILARKTPRRSHFWLRLLIGFGMFSLVRYGIFTGVLPRLTGWDRLLRLTLAFTSFIPRRIPIEIA